MRCQMAEKKLALIAGGELSSRQSRRIKKHLAACPECRREYQLYMQAAKQMHAWMDADTPDWDETEWQRVLRKAETAAPEREPSPAPRRFKPVWAGALFLLAAIVLYMVVWFPFSPSGDEVSPRAVFMQETPQDTVSVTFVSQETGLKIKWFIKKDFELQEMNP